MGVDVDEPGGDHVPLGIHHVTRLRGPVQLADGFDLSPGDADLPREPRVAGPVGNARIDDQGVEHSSHHNAKVPAFPSRNPVGARPHPHGRRAGGGGLANRHGDREDAALEPNGCHGYALAFARG